MEQRENESGLIDYNELAIKHNMAFAAFKTRHEAIHPLPTKSEVKRDYVSMIIVTVLTIVMVAAVLVSSSRTVAEFGGGIIGFLAFVMIEGGIMAYAFFTARRRVSEDSKERIKHTLRWASVGLVLTFIVGLGANIDNTLASKAEALPPAVKTIIDLLVALSAPTLAFISSDVLAIELMASAFRQAQADKDYAAALVTWHDALARSWSAQQSRWGVRVDLEPQKQITADNSLNLIKFNEISRKKPSPKLQKALNYLRLNEGDLFTAPRELELKIPGVSYGTIHSAQKMIQAEKQANQNGDGS